MEALCRIWSSARSSARSCGRAGRPPNRASVGVEPGPRRRTPGLRREEVAQLAGLSVTWYTWLEQARDINVSDQVLDSLSRTLRLDHDERSHLFTLAAATDPVTTAECDAVPRQLLAVLAKVDPYPACVQGARC